MAHLLTDDYKEKEGAHFASVWEDLKAYCLSECKPVGDQIGRIEKVLGALVRS